MVPRPVPPTHTQPRTNRENRPDRRAQSPQKKFDLKEGSPHSDEPARRAMTKLLAPLLAAALAGSATAFAAHRRGPSPSAASTARANAASMSDELGLPCVEECALTSYPNMPESVHPGVVTGQAMQDLLDHAKANGASPLLLPRQGCVRGFPRRTRSRGRSTGSASGGGEPARARPGAPSDRRGERRSSRRCGLRGRGRDAASTADEAVAEGASAPSASQPRQWTGASAAGGATELDVFGAAADVAAAVAEGASARGCGIRRGCVRGGRGQTRP